MPNEIEIKQGMDLRLEGAPSTEIRDALAGEKIVIYPPEITGLKPRLLVKEGDTVQRGTALLYDKKHENFKLRSPDAGTVESIVLGPRRSLQEIHIVFNGTDEAETFKKYSAKKVLEEKRDKLIAHLEHTGALAWIQERPFSKPAQASSEPGSIFVNAMSNAPFRPDPHVVVRGNEKAFQVGLNTLKALTDGEVNLCIGTHIENPSTAITQAENVKTFAFSGPHPSGNTSTHIHHIDPIAPGDVVWAMNACDVILLGSLVNTGLMPNEKTIVAAGTGLKDEARAYYRVKIGGSLANILDGNTEEAETRVVNGDVFAGAKLKADGHLRMLQRSLLVLKEDRERHFLGWMAPGASVFSTYRAFLSKWLSPQRTWDLGTSRCGSLRSMVLTGIYDQYVPLDILVDYLIRACISHDTDDAIHHGILGTDPEDFALCSIICPSKTDFSSIVKRTLAEIEAEGI